MLPIVIALIALVAVIYWQGNKNKPKRYSSWKRVKGFTLLCQRAPGEEKAEALALLEWKKAPWRGKVAAVEKALYLLEKDRF